MPGVDAGRLVSSLRYRVNRVFWYGTSLSSVSQGAFLVTASWLAFRIGGSDAVGIVTFSVMIPFVVATPIGGLLADRMDRRDIILACQAAQAVIALALGVQAAVARPPLWELALLVFAAGTARAVELPTTSSVLPNLVPQTELLNTFSLNSLATQGSRFSGPVAVAPLLAVGGASSAFVAVAAIYLPALYLTGRVPPQRAGRVAVSTFEQLREGARYVREHAAVALLLALVVLHCSLTMSYDSTLPLFADDNLGGGGAIYSTMVACIGIGAICGTLLLAGLRRPALRGPLLFGGGIASGLTTLMLALSGVWPLALLALLAVGASQTLFMTLCTTLVQESVPDHLRGRANGIMLMSAGGIMSFANLANGYLADRFSVTPVLAIPAATFVIVLLLVSSARPALRRIYREGALPAEALAAAG